MVKCELDLDALYEITEYIKGSLESSTSVTVTAADAFNELQRQYDELSESVARLEQAFKQFAEFIEERLDALENTREEIYEFKNTREQINEPEPTREQLECGQGLSSALDLDCIFKRKE